MAVHKKNKKTKVLDSMKPLELQGYISELIESRSITGKCVWKFRLGKLTFHFDDKEINVDFTKYLVKIVKRPKKKPPKNIQVWLENIELPQNTKHIYPDDGSLCLFKPENFKWEKWMTIEKHLFTTICTWLYHYEKWKQTGIWHGEEAKH